MRNDGKEGKLASYIFYEKILKNESCAAFSGDQDWPVGKNMIFYR